jgi:putative salt-induced outer membrane protein YdiY
MIRNFQNLIHFAFARIGLALFLICASNGAVFAQQVILHLKSGDRISGTIVSESANQVVISNVWNKALSIPLAEISKREIKKGATSSLIAGKTTASQITTVAIARHTLKPAAKSKGQWRGDARVGLDAIVSTPDQQDYSGHLQLVYEHPYTSDPKKFFRNTADFDGEYQRTDGQESANHVFGSNKSDFDLEKSYYGYGLFGTGYDEISKINFQYQIGPGLGTHLIQETNFVMNVESGMNYETQYREDTSNLEAFYARLAEDFTWKICRNLKLVENLAFYPDVEHGGQFHNNFESTLSYGFWKNLTLNFTTLDYYDTQAAEDVNPNRFEVRSSLGVTF